MRAVLSVENEGVPPIGTGIVVAAVFALIITLAMTLSVRERRQFSELLEYAARENWYQVTDPAGLPQVVADAMLSKRSKLFRRFRTMPPLWVSWHQGTEIARGGAYNDSTQRWTWFLSRQSPARDLAIAEAGKPLACGRSRPPNVT